MAVTDLQKCRHIINTYGSKGEKEALDKLRGLTWDRFDLSDEAYGILDAIVTNYMLDTANETYANVKDEHNNEWYMLGND